MIEVWIVDDVARHRDEVAQIIKSTNADIKLQQFQKAQDALDELEKRANNNSALPKIIILDRNLGADSGNYQFGENVAREIKSRAEFKNIIIIAHSNIIHRGEDMVKAGADIAIPKNKLDQLSDYLRNKITK